MINCINKFRWIKLNQKGFALVVAAMFTILIIISLGIFSLSTYEFREVKTHEEEYARGYYGAIAGLRYAYMLLHDPDIIDGLESGPYTVTGDEYGGDFFGDLEVTADELTITITKIETGVDAGKYDVEASYDL